jgi:hypothetical protein
MAGLALTGCSSPPPQKVEKPAEAAPAPKITQFYASPPEIGKGQRAQLCYGVEGAAKVELEPAVEAVWPALSRCLEVRPNVSVTYTLTALNAAGQSVTQKAKLEVGPPRPGNAQSGGGSRMLQAVTADKLQVKPGEQVTICFAARHATEVAITPGPGVQPSAERGCFTDKPTRTTAYKVVAKGDAGQTDTEQVTVKVR